MGDDNLLKNLDFIINHVFFPPQLPQESDLSTAGHFALCSSFVDLADEFEAHLDGDSRLGWTRTVNMLRQYARSQNRADLIVEDLEKDFKQLDPGDFLILYIGEQNAGIFIRRMASGDVSVSSFEASFPNAEVMAAEARIACTFPGPAITVPFSVWHNPSFSHELSNFLFHMNRDRLDEAKAHARKAMSEVTETRDVTDPKYISELLMGILHGVGSPTPIEDVRFARKRIGDDVLWENATLPWRRSPVYLVLRVGLQLALSYIDGPGDLQYKTFMAFAQARLLQMAVQNHPELDTDLLYAMRVKVARRIHKLEICAKSDGTPSFVIYAAQHASSAVQQVLDDRWNRVQQLQDQSPEWNPDSLNFEADTYLLLKNARPRILRAAQRADSPPPSSTFTPNHHPRLRYETDFRGLTPAKLQAAFDDDARVALADFEFVIHTYLRDWTARNLTGQDASEIIYSCMTAYLSCARKTYSTNNPEDQSHMLLALVTMWVALDKVVVTQVPLLAQFSPEVSVGLLEPLLLQQTDALDALRDVVHYISGRQNEAQWSDGIFTDNSYLFYQQYFDSSVSLQLLKQEIEEEANRKREVCRSLLREKNARYNDLTTRAMAFDHDHRQVEYRWGWSREFREDKSMCRKCALLDEASSIPDIEVDEWPLPSGLTDAKGVCFELDCPKPFEYWRAATWMLLYDVGAPSHREAAEKYDTLPGSYALPRRSSPVRFTLATATKSFKVSHYRSRTIPAREQDVIVNCGSTWRLYEISQGCWAGDRPFQYSSFRRMCTPSISGKYKALQFSLESTTHTSNEVIAAQSDCHADLSLHEFVAFGSLRSGGRLQWMNIARECVTGTLTFRSEAVHTLLLQAALQVGNWENEGGLILDWHRDLADPLFSHTLLESLETLMHTISSNWDAVVSLRGIILLTCRLMSGNHSPATEDWACKLLCRAREISVNWMVQMKEQLSSASEDHSDVLRIRLCEIAATCRATYSGDPAHFPKLLQTSEDISTFIHCASVIYENTPPVCKDLSPAFCRLLDQDKRLSISIHDHLVSLVMQSNTGIDKAVEFLWPAYRQGNVWQRLSQPNERWIQTSTACSSHGVSQQVHVNLIDGQLRVDGKLVGQLPREITRNPLYVRCLGQRILDVIPSDMPGMEYATRNRVDGCEIHFSTQDMADGLIIKTKGESGEISELIPHKFFRKDLPNPLVQEYAHWFRVSRQFIELCPLHSIWCSLPSNNHISDVLNSAQMILAPHKYLVDPHSLTGRMLSSQLEPLEYSDEILITLLSGGAVTADLPRLRLAFHLKGQLLRSKNLPGFCVDRHQSTGTMLGLKNQLVLRPFDSSSTEMRRVLIPHGFVCVQKGSDHVSIEIRTDRSMKQTRYHEYLVDTDLGYLQTNASLTSRLYKVYLHAVTSGRLPDPLTRRTGTEEALLEYSSASCITFLELRSSDRELLKVINAISPTRTFYPKHLQVMQTVAWDSNLPPLSQHSAFSHITDSIREYAQKLALFDRPNKIDSNNSVSSEPSSEQILMKKAEHREALFHSPDLHGVSDLTSEDSRHTLSSITPALSVSRKSKEISLSFTHRLLAADAELPDLYSLFKEWNLISSQTDIDISYRNDLLSPQFGEVYLSMFNVLRKQRIGEDYRCLFTFSAMSYHSPVYMKLIPTFLAFGTNFRFQSFSLPKLASQCSVYDLAFRLAPEPGDLRQLAYNAAHGMEKASWDANGLLKDDDESGWAFSQRVNKSYEDQRNRLVSQITQHYVSQWPCSTVYAPSNPIFAPLFNMHGLHNSMQTRFANCFQNKELHSFLVGVQSVLVDSSREICSYPELGKMLLPPDLSAPSSPYLLDKISLRHLLASREVPDTKNTTWERGGSVIPDTQELGKLLEEFTKSSKPLLRVYGEHLDASLLALRSEQDLTSSEADKHLHYLQICNERFTNLEEAIKKGFQPQTKAQQLSQDAGQWPRLTVRTFLRQLSIKLRESYPEKWRTTLADLACRLVHIHRARRLIEFQCSHSPHYSQEVEATPISVAEASQNPDWALIQVESRFTLRPLQHIVLKEMISPSSNKNTAFQLNMGEGKSSVIAPLAVATLADQKTLVRLVVLKPLSRQMFHLLAARLTGVCGRRVFFLPFSRSVDMGPSQIRGIRSLLEECVAVGGILIAQPEHILSFRLLAVERLVTGHPTRSSLLELQKWLSSCSRDILDESDEILHSKYQLIYTIGDQQPLEDHPDRWTTVQQVLSLVSCHLNRLRKKFPLDVEVETNKPGLFPFLRLLKPTPGTDLVEWIADDIMAGKLENVNFRFLNHRDRQAVRRFITGFNVNAQDIIIAKRCFDSSGKWNSVLLLRGLLAHGLICYVFLKRHWRVDYGLDLTRSMLAVPFRAKDVPSTSAEFGHSDIALLLTCLSYYYRGLDENQLRTAIQLLLSSDNAAAEYETWTSGLDLPEELRRETGINLEDPTQLADVLVPRFRRTKNVVDFYLSAVVFPKAAKEFPYKLSTSAWDLVENSERVKTGFSGTNDNQHLLPTSIHQEDLAGQESTSAKVLLYLQQPENGPCITPGDLSLKHVPLKDLLFQMASRSPPVRILFDVGAQVLRINRKVAEVWLQIDNDAQAAVYFDHKDEITVLMRDGAVEPFISSSFRDRLGDCIIYLDDAHTRGTDLKFPRGSRALVTLGNKVTKDRLVQACMRLRQLGHGHSVLFFAPLEIAQAIRAAANKSDGVAIKVIDILRWAMLRTCEDIEHHIPHWVQQGVDFHQRDLVWAAAKESDSPSNTAKESDSPSNIAELRSGWQQPEARTLEQLYLPPSAQSSLNTSPNVAKVNQIPEMQARLDMLGITDIGDASVDEEQEREIEQEIEQERQLKRPPRAKPHTHRVSDEVRVLVKTGILKNTSAAFQPLFNTIPAAVVAAVRQHLRPVDSPWRHTLWATKDFAIAISDTETSKEHMRPVNWVLSCPSSDLAMNIVVLSPYEAQELLPAIRKSTHVNLHMYAPRVRREMRTFDDLKFFCIPPLAASWDRTSPDMLAISQLNLFSGQLYIGNYNIYRNLCAFLGLGVDFEDVTGPSVNSDGFVRPEERMFDDGGFYQDCPFVVSPVPFLKELTSLRRKGNKYRQTHIGRIVNGIVLRKEDFE
ncbi:hypothetical protein BDP27DRAFT_1332732 [Rhodocollybia butyracea]|uniref:ubiquitinyl hydrolase 1 n=1 Tax=Rhodocollybia butyracea TaxID=206335 RepID=A0A9P5PN77_9AGAR|nr:hypothetical protein BDP27DRAFT_1332732 [Rhodocollybia butyracea]